MAKTSLTHKYTRHEIYWYIKKNKQHGFGEEMLKWTAQVPIRLCSKGTVVDCSLSTGHKYIVMICESTIYAIILYEHNKKQLLYYIILYS